MFPKNPNNPLFFAMCYHIDMNIDDYNFELLAAVERNDSAGVAFLLPKANPQHKHSLPFRKAAQLGHI